MFASTRSAVRPGASCALGLALLMTMPACRGDSTDKAKLDAATDAGPGGAVLYGDDTLDVRVDMAKSDWQTLRGEGRSFCDVLSGCIDRSFEYTTVAGAVTINGTKFARAGVRKKGFLGSLSAVKPSLRIDLAKYDEGQSFDGAEDLILNNSRQDLSYTHQCMAYALFRAAHVPAPRCSFSQVTVNGKKLGSYVQVEPIKKALLERELGDSEGDLYEGSASVDFTRDLLGGFEKKTNEDAKASPELARLSRALESEGAEMLKSVQSLVDLEEFMRFWATEVLIGHWDGYSGNINNFYVYVSATDHKLSFLPWGTDGAFDRNHPFLPLEGRPQSVFATGRLARRLYEYDVSRAMYEKTLRKLLDEVWNEKELLAEVDRIAGLVGDDADSKAITAQREFIRTRRKELLKELDGPTPAWPFPERTSAGCHPELVTPIEGAFDTTWGAPDDLTLDFNGALKLTLDSKVTDVAPVVERAGFAMDPVFTGNVLRLAGMLDDGSLVFVQLSTGPLPITPGELLFHGFETYGLVLHGADKDSLSVVGMVNDGSIVFERASTKEGAAVRGHFKGKLVQFSATPGGVLP